ncbi:MAG: FHA domain-containing protein [Planctomycetia bacterium]
MVVRFHVVSPAAKQRTFTVRLPILLGRGEEAKFRIQHDLVSRKHCEFFERRGQVFVRDLGSTNGTFLNDEQVPVSTKTAVPPGATMRVGGLSFRVEYEAPAGSDSTATVEGQVRVDHVAAGESSVETGERPLDDLEEGPDFKIEHAEQGDEAAAGSVVAADAAAPAGETVPVAASSSVAAEPVSEAVVPEANELPSASVEPATGFAFLAGADSAATPEQAADWPTGDAATAADAPDDDQLNAFFKGLK